METTINEVEIELCQGNIAAQDDVQAVVNAANAELKTGGGVAGALHRSAGPELARAGEKYAPIKPGEAVITPGFNLANDHVIHCLGPVYGRDKPEDDLLASCYIEASKLAEENNIETLAFPAISTGAFGYPMDEAVGVALNTVIEQTENLSTVRLIRFVLFDGRSLKIHQEKLSELCER